MKTTARSPLVIIFVTVFIDLIGFGMVIPLVALYGKHFGATGIQLAILGSIYSFMQFFFAPLWGSLSDRAGRRPILLMSLAGSATSYLIFGLASSFWWLVFARAMAGIFAANISTAQAYIADVTTPENRAKGMGLIGAAFGIGFTLGPPLGGISAAKVGLWAPGLFAAAVCGLNLIFAVFKLPESLSKDMRLKARPRSLTPINFKRLRQSWQESELWFLFLIFFFVTFAFSNMEQTFSLLFEQKFALTTANAGYKTGIVLMFSGFLGALIQGGLIRKLVPKFGEHKLLIAGLLLYVIGMALFPFGPTYTSYFLLVLPFALGSGLINPSLSSLISRNAKSNEQGEVLGLSQGLGSLARALGPFCGLSTFAILPFIPYAIGATLCFFLFVASLIIWKRRVLVL
jgi:DHA1 family tetracycline resistance protein-like MFS transporter